MQRNAIQFSVLLMPAARSTSVRARHPPAARCPPSARLQPRRDMGNKRLGVNRAFGTEQEHLLFVDVVTVVGGAGFGECRQVGGAGHRMESDRAETPTRMVARSERNMGRDLAGCDVNVVTLVSFGC